MFERLEFSFTGSLISGMGFWDYSDLYANYHPGEYIWQRVVAKLYHNGAQNRSICFLSHELGRDYD